MVTRHNPIFSFTFGGRYLPTLARSALEAIRTEYMKTYIKKAEIKFSKHEYIDIEVEISDDMEVAVINLNKLKITVPISALQELQEKIVNEGWAIAMYNNKICEV